MRLKFIIHKQPWTSRCKYAAFATFFSQILGYISQFWEKDRIELNWSELQDEKSQLILAGKKTTTVLQDVNSEFQEKIKIKIARKKIIIIHGGGKKSEI